jgi:hypothetical protein
VLPNGTTNVGNRVVVSPEGATATIGKLSAQQIVAANISSLTITNESVSFPPFQITDIGVSGSNVVLSWNTQGITNAVQVTTNTTGGYSPSNFVNLATIPVVTTPTTNYIDMGGATNKPTRYYRISQPLP